MARFVGLAVYFFANDNLNTALQDSLGGYTRPITDMSYVQVVDGLSRLTVEFPVTSTFGDLEVLGNVMLVNYVDEWYGNVVYAGEGFEITDIQIMNQPDGPDMVVLTGESLARELADKHLWYPIGTEVQYNTTLALDAHDDSVNTLSSAALQNDTVLSLNSVTTPQPWKESDYILVELDGGGWHPTIVDSIEGTDITIRDALPAAAASGNDVHRYNRRITLTSNNGAYVGARVFITMNDATVHANIIEEMGEVDGVMKIYLRDGMDKPADAGKAVTISNYETPTNSNLSQLDGHMPTEWQIAGATGTVIPTRHPPDGMSFLDVLQQIVDLTGEHWRMDVDYANGKPIRRIKWITPSGENSGNGGIVNIVVPRTVSEATYYSTTITENSAIVEGQVTSKRRKKQYTRIYPTAGSGYVSLYSVSAAMEATINGMGYQIVRTGEYLASYEPPYIADVAEESASGIRGVQIGFPDVTTESASPAVILSAADMLALEAATWLRDNAREYREIDVTDVLWNCSKPPYAGQKVHLAYTSYPHDSWQETWDSGTDPLYIKRVEMTWSSDKELRVSLNLVNDLSGPEDDGASMARRFNNYDLATRRGVSVTSSPVDFSFFGYISSDDHTHSAYMPRTGGQFTGNVSASSGVTFDGVDLSAHASNPSAHHSPVTAYDTSMGVSGQAVYVTPGLNSGLITSAGLKISLRSDSGMSLDSGGLGLGSPGTNSAASANTVAGSTHTHAITSTSDGNSTVGTLLKGDAEGGLTLGRLAVGASVDTSATLKAISKANDDYTLYLKQKSGQTADVWRVEDSSGSPLVRLTGGGNLESGTPAFVSGLTGWRIEGATGNAEFNDIVARGEFHASIFVADEMHATGGTLAVMTASKVVDGIANNTMPGAVGSTFIANIQAQHTDPGLSYFAVGDVLRLKWIRVNLGGTVMDGRDVYLEVVSVFGIEGRDLSENEPGYYPTTCRWLYGGEAGYVLPTGTAIVKWAEKGKGSGFTGGMLITSDLTYAPYISIFTIDSTRTTANWQSAPATPIERVRVGNLNGILGKSTAVWGIAAGDNLSDASESRKYIEASSAGVTLQNVSLTLYDGADPTVSMSSAGNVKFGTDTGSGTTTTLEFLSSTGTLRVGPSSGPSMYWSGTDLSIRNSSNSPVISLNSSGGASFEGVVTLGSGGGIYQGNGTFASPGTGLKIWRDGTMGRMATYNSGTTQVEFDTSGKLKAGGGYITIDSVGMTIREGGSESYNSSINWVTSTGRRMAYLIAYDNSSTDYLYLKTQAPGIGKNSSIQIKADADSGYDSFITITASQHSGERSALYLWSGYDSVGAPAMVVDTTRCILAQGDTDWHIMDMRSSDVSHGMTAIAPSQSTFGSFKKIIDDNGGLEVAGWSDDNIGVNLRGFVINEVTTTATSSRAVTMIEAAKQTSTTSTSVGSTANILAVRNSGSTVFIIKGNGNFHYDGTGSSYDDYDDIALLRTADMALSDRLDATWESWLGYNRDDLEAAGIVTFDGDSAFVNGARMNRLLAGSVWQLHDKMTREIASLRSEVLNLRSAIGQGDLDDEVTGLDSGGV
jgi:hypothetical protein